VRAPQIGSLQIALNPACGGSLWSIIAFRIEVPWAKISLELLGCCCMQGNAILSFEFEPLTDDDSVRSIVPIVNGVRLTTLIKEFESEHQYKPVGGYAGIVPAHFNFGSLDQYFMASSPNPVLPGQRCYLLGCECGEVGCWPLEAHIVVYEREIVWESFKQPFRPERDYSSFGLFRFDLDQYRQSVVALAAALHR
jgi:hypothetical protein